MEKVCATVKIQKSYETAVKEHRDIYTSYTSRKLSAKRPTWIIGSEDDSQRSWENKKYITHDNGTETTNNQKNMKNCSKISTSDAVNSLTAMPSVSLGKSSLDHHKHSASSSSEAEHQNKPMGKHKKIVEPSITPVCTPVSDSEDCYRNSHVMLPASIERLLPIGASRSQDLNVDSSKDNNLCADLENQLEIPNQERLLPIGQHNKDISQLVDKVRQALGINAQVQQPTKERRSENKGAREELHHSHSPRKLIKQVALESPPNQNEMEDHSDLCRCLNTDLKSNWYSVGQVGSCFHRGLFCRGSHVAAAPEDQEVWTV